MTNSPNNLVKIALIGIPAIEQRRLNVAFEHSKSRRICYASCELNDSEPQILVVNADEPVHLITWRIYRNKLEQHSSVVPPSMLVSRKREFKTDHYQVKRPLISSRVISVLDQIATSVLKISEDVAFTEEDITEFIEIAAPPNEEHSHRILIIDDSLPVRVQMKQALRGVNANLDFAETGEEAFEHVNENNYDIIFLDVVLPGMDGYDVCKVIKHSKAKILQSLC